MTRNKDNCNFSFFSIRTVISPIIKLLQSYFYPPHFRPLHEQYPSLVRLQAVEVPGAVHDDERGKDDSDFLF